MSKDDEYAIKKKIANDYLKKQGIEMDWDDLPDINSLHDAETEADIIHLVHDRLENSGFPMDLFEND